MFVVHIYAETDSATPRSAERMAGYVLEYITPSGKTVTKECFRKLAGTYHAVILQILNEAVGRISRECEIHIHTQDTFILNMLEHNLQEWAANDFRNHRGDPVRNDGQWRKLWEQTRHHLLAADPGMHSYYAWMQEEMTQGK